MPWNEGTALCLADLRWGDGAPVVASPRQILRAQLDRLARARPGGVRRHRARVHRLPRHLRGGVREGLPRPQAGQPVQRRLLGPRRLARGAAAAQDPQPDGRRGHGGRELQGRVQRRPARDQLPLRAGAADRRRARRSTRRARRRSPRRRAWRSRSWPSTTQREGISCHIHLSLRRDGAAAFAHDEAAVRALRRRPARLPARAEPVLRAQRQLLQALREGLVRAHRGRLGPRQPHVRGARRRPRRRAAGRAAPAGRGRQPVPGAGGDDRRGPARARRRAGARAAAGGQRLRVRQAARADDAGRGARAVRGQRRRARGVRRGGRRRTTSTTPASSSTAFEAAVTDWERTGFERL